MTAIPSLRKVELCCDIALVVAVIFTACRTFTVLHALGNPIVKGEHRIDLMDEIAVMAFVLNVVLPLATVALGVSTVIKIRARPVEPLMVSLNVAGIVGVFA